MKPNYHESQNGIMRSASNMENRVAANSSPAMKHQPVTMPHTSRPIEQAHTFDHRENEGNSIMNQEAVGRNGHPYRDIAASANGQQPRTDVRANNVPLNLGTNSSLVEHRNS